MRHILTIILLMNSARLQAAENETFIAEHFIPFAILTIVIIALVTKYVSAHKTNKLLKASNEKLLEAQEALKNSELRFYAMAENLDDIIWFADASLNKLLYINASYEKIYGKTAESLYENPMSYVECIHPDDLPHLQLQDKNVTAPITNQKLRVINQKTGRVYWVLSRYAPIRNSEGDIIFISGIISDITQLVTAEDEKAIQKQIIAQQSKFVSLGEMIGAVAHQWRQPLNALSIYVQMMDESENREETAKFIEESMKLIEHMSETIDDFRDFFKTGKQPEPFDAPRTVMQILRMLAPQLKANNIAFHVNCTCENRSFSCANNYDPGNPPCRNLVSGIVNEFKHAILNIIQNAKEEFAENNKSDRSIYIDMSARNGQFTISITDSAGGIDNNILPHIFEAYSSAKKDGTGMGLYMTKIIIEEKMDGKISAQNTDIGAKFTIELPCVSE